MVATKTKRVKSAKAPARRDFLEYERLNEERLEAGRLADSLKKQQYELLAKFRDYAVTMTKRKTIKEVVVAGFRIILGKARQNVKWKQEYVKLFGDEAAEKMKDSQPLGDTIEIERVK